mmetsp:Transcript_22120/g.32475  ORF Transcript_22120/g.32475 Transcript_22120/m.32475 type:complete len:86 (+) Transcript_22120:120-377(+)
MCVCVCVRGEVCVCVCVCVCVRHPPSRISANSSKSVDIVAPHAKYPNTCMCSMYVCVICMWERVTHVCVCVCAWRSVCVCVCVSC